MRIQMAVENHVSDYTVPASCPIQNIQCITLLRAYGNRINDCRDRIIRFEPPLVIVNVEHMRLLDSSVDQADFRRISDICPENRRRRIPIYPGTHRDILSGLRMKPFRAGRLYNHGPKKSMDVGGFFTAPGIRHIMEKENAFRVSIPGVFRLTACRAVLIEPGAGSV